MILNSLVNIACTILAFGLLHSLSRRSAERTYSHVNSFWPVDAWSIYFVVFFSGLMISFHVVGAAALVTGSKLVHITTLTGVLALLWGAERWIMGPLQGEREILSYAGALRQTCDEIRSVDPLVRWSAMVAGGII